MSARTIYQVSDLIKEKRLAIGDGFRAKNRELSNEGLPFLRAANLNNGFDFTDVDRVPHVLARALGEKVSQTGDSAFTSKGTVGRLGYVREGTPTFVYSPQICFWRSLDHSFLHPRYLYSWMCSPEFEQQWRSVAGQTDMAPYVSLRDQRNMFITIPPMSEQLAIAEVLGALDDKIELNRKMNATLDELARTIFRSWFVDFDPVRAKMEGREPFGMDAEAAALFPNRLVDSSIGTIPEGWRVSSIGEIAEVIDCLHSKKPDRQESGRYLIQLNNIRDDGLLDMSSPYLISDQDYQKWTSRMEAMEGDCVITNVGRVGAVSQVPAGVKGALGRNMTGIRCRNNFPFPRFLISVLLSDFMKREIQRNEDVGTILSALNVKNIPKLRLVLPGTELLDEFEKKVEPLRLMMEMNLQESRTLAELRDTLLPELISGRIRVPEAEKAVAEVV